MRARELLEISHCRTQKESSAADSHFFTPEVSRCSLLFDVPSQQEIRAWEVMYIQAQFREPGLLPDNYQMSLTRRVLGLSTNVSSSSNLEARMQGLLTPLWR